MYTVEMNTTSRWEDDAKVEFLQGYLERMTTRYSNTWAWICHFVADCRHRRASFQAPVVPLPDIPDALMDISSLIHLTAPSVRASRDALGL
jgi:hypothetical protein